MINLFYVAVEIHCLRSPEKPPLTEGQSSPNEVKYNIAVQCFLHINEQFLYNSQILKFTVIFETVHSDRFSKPTLLLEIL